MHRMIGTGRAVPGDGIGKFAGAGVDKENRTTFGGDDVKEQCEELPLERIDVAHGTDGGADFQQSRESARKADRRRKSRERFGLQVEKIVRLELLGGKTEAGLIVELHGGDFGSRSGFRKKEEGRITYRDLVSESENSLADRNAVDEGAGWSV